jgi:hypothetical protein
MYYPGVGGVARPAFRAFCGPSLWTTAGGFKIA